VVILNAIQLINALPYIILLFSGFTGLFVISSSNAALTFVNHRTIRHLILKGSDSGEVSCLVWLYKMLFN